jgi:hypothetical protein
MSPKKMIGLSLRLRAQRLRGFGQADDRRSQMGAPVLHCTKKSCTINKKLCKKACHFRGGDGILFNTHFVEKGEMV